MPAAQNWSPADLKFTEEEEIDYIVSLGGMTTIGWTDAHNLLLQVHPEETTSPFPYFKVFNAAPVSGATQMARIRFDQPLYEMLAPKWYRGKKQWWLTTSEKRNLADFLNAPADMIPDCSNWQYSILAYNMEKGLHIEQTRQNLLSRGSLPYPDYLPYDLKMPDYMLLPDGE